jgi:hypothetical protein
MISQVLHHIEYAGQLYSKPTLLFSKYLCVYYMLDRSSSQWPVRIFYSGFGFGFLVLPSLKSWFYK